MKKWIVNFERPKEDGFDSARCELLDYKWTERQGYSDEEIAMFEELLHSNAHLLPVCREWGDWGEERWTKIALIEKNSNTIS